MFGSLIFACPHGGIFNNYLVFKDEPGPGKSAQNRVFSFVFNRNGSSIQNEEGQTVFWLSLKKAKRATAFWFISPGGNGAHGVHGQKGKDGRTKVDIQCDGLDFFHCAFYGKNGDDGQNGSDGQNGGDGGNIQIHFVSSNKTHRQIWDLFRKKVRFSFPGGKGGKRGLGGAGGIGAFGTCHWHPKTFGEKGKRGSDGKKGLDGNDGKDGSSGSLCLIFQEVEMTPLGSTVAGAV